MSKKCADNYVIGTAVPVGDSRLPERMELRTLGGEVVHSSPNWTTTLIHLGYALDHLATKDTEIATQAEEICALHTALFHVENGLNHPEERVQKLIEAANAVAAAEAACPDGAAQEAEKVPFNARERAFKTMDEAEERQRKFAAEEAEKGEG